MSVIPDSHTVRLLVSVSMSHTVEGRALIRASASKNSTRPHQLPVWSDRSFTGQVHSLFIGT